MQTTPAQFVQSSARAAGSFNCRAWQAKNNVGAVRHLKQKTRGKHPRGGRGRKARNIAPCPRLTNAGRFAVVPFVGQAKTTLAHSSVWGGKQRESIPQRAQLQGALPGEAACFVSIAAQSRFGVIRGGDFFNFPIQWALCPASPNELCARSACFLRNLERARYCGRKRRFPLVHFSRMNGILGCNRKIRFCLTNAPALCYNTKAIHGEMSEWFKEPVLKTGDAARHRGFESLSLRQI